MNSSIIGKVGNQNQNCIGLAGSQVIHYNSLCDVKSDKEIDM